MKIPLTARIGRALPLLGFSINGIVSNHHVLQPSKHRMYFHTLQQFFQSPSKAQRNEGKAPNKKLFYKSTQYLSSQDNSAMENDKKITKQPILDFNFQYENAERKLYLLK